MEPRRPPSPAVPRSRAPQAPPPVAPAQPLSRAAETGTPADVEVLTTDRPGSDFMVDVIKSLGIDYVCANPGSSFRGLHESIVNYGGNTKPELITCMHEESSVAMGHGYAKIEGKPLGVLLHSNVGLQHAAMAIYNAYCDRVPVYLIVGNSLDATARRPGVEWAHSAQDVAAMVRDCVKWDDVPLSLTHFAESAVRAYKIAMTPPTMPVLIVADGELQERAGRGGRRAARAEAVGHRPAARRLRRRRGSGAAAGGGRDAGARRRPRRAHARRAGAAGRARRNAAGAGRRPMGPAEFSDAGTRSITPTTRARSSPAPTSCSVSS